jgi:hypothetical protein
MGKSKRLRAGRTREERMLRRRAEEAVQERRRADRALWRLQHSCAHEQIELVSGEQVCRACGLNLTAQSERRRKAGMVLGMARALGANPMGRGGW